MVLGARARPLLLEVVRGGAVPRVVRMVCGHPRVVLCLVRSSRFVRPLRQGSLLGAVRRPSSASAAAFPPRGTSSFASSPEQDERREQALSASLFSA